MQIDHHEPKAWLEAEFNIRRSKNPRYSLRAFAQHLDLPAGRLSEIFSGKRRITLTQAEKIADRLLLRPSDRSKFLDLVRKARRETSTNEIDTEVEFKQLPADAFSAIADWHHFAILSLMDTADFSEDPKWISKRLGISPLQAREAILRLIRLKLLDRDTGKLRKTANNVTTTHDLESVALKLSHKQSLEQALAAINEVPVELRDITSMTMAVDLMRLPKAKEMIKKFRRQLCAYLESGDVNQATEVYNVNIQLVPITKVRKT